MADNLATLATRCASCGSFWMYPCLHAGVDNVRPVCPCGGRLEAVDMVAEIAKRPYVPFKVEEKK